MPICRAAIDTARTAERLCHVVDTTADDAVLDLILGLVEFVHDSVEATSDALPSLAVHWASKSVQRLKHLAPRHANKVSWPLLAELIRIAPDGRRLDESQVRRYGNTGKHSGRHGTVVRRWSKHWELIRRVTRLLPRPHQRRYFTAELFVTDSPERT
jgi:hypothetical protein